MAAGGNQPVMPSSFEDEFPPIQIQLIEMVRNFPLIYAIGPRSQEDKAALSEIWHKISEKLGVCSYRCQNYWNTICYEYAKVRQLTRILPVNAVLSFRRARKFFIVNFEFINNYVDHIPQNEIPIYMHVMYDCQFKLK